MKLFKLFLAAPVVIFFLVLFSGPTLSSCNKANLHDTITIVKNDTIIKNDTTVIVDSIYGLHCGLVAYYNFNGGTLHDSSGMGNDIYATNNVTLTTDRFGRANNAYSFDGSTSFMHVANSQSLNPTNITLMAIVKLTGYNLGPCFISQILIKGYNDQSQGIYGLRLLPGIGGACALQQDSAAEKVAGYYGGWGSTTGSLDSVYQIKPNTWFTMVYTFDGSVSKMYVNGQLNDTHIGTAQFNPNTDDLSIGMTYNPSFYYNFQGAIDEIRIYNKALSAAAVKQLSNVTE